MAHQLPGEIALSEERWDDALRELVSHRGVLNLDYAKVRREAENLLCQTSGRRS